MQYQDTAARRPAAARPALPARQLSREAALERRNEMKRTAAPRPRPGHGHWICVGCGDWAVCSSGGEDADRLTDFGLCPGCLEAMLEGASTPFAQPPCFSVTH